MKHVCIRISILSYCKQVHRVVRHEDLSSETLFGCELSIPGVKGYLVREESVYKHRGGSKYN